MSNRDPLRPLLDEIEAFDLEYEDGGVLDVVGVESVDQKVRVRVAFSTFGDRRSHWLIEAEGIAETSFQLGGHYWPEWHDEHPLLLDHLEPRVDLYFRGPATSTSSLLGDLLVAHQSVMGSWRPVEAFFNSAFRPTDIPAKLLTASHGLLAQGPRTLIEAYSDVLKEHGIHGGSLVKTPAKRILEPNTWIEETRDLHVLTISRDGITGNTAAEPEWSYMVAERLSCHRIPGHGNERGAWP